LQIKWHVFGVIVGIVLVVVVVVVVGAAAVVVFLGVVVALP